MRPVPFSAMAYVAAVFLSLIPAFMARPGPADEVWVGLAAVLMAFGFYVAGLNIGGAPELLRLLLLGLCVGLFAEAVVVVHDTVSPNQWFPDPMEGRARGTFKANGQLGAYGFCAAGLFVTFGLTRGTPRFRRICLAAGIVAASFVFLASRRTGMIAVFLWGAMLLLIGRRFSGRRAYRIFLGSCAALLVLVAAFWPQISSSFAGRRLTSAVVGLSHREGFIQNQFRDTIQTADRWFPLGFGVSRGYLINPRESFEIHNGILAVLVELGVLGLAGYGAMLAGPLLNARRRPGKTDSDLFRVLLLSFGLAVVVFMFHNTLFRDRTFLLFLGVATAVAPNLGRSGETARPFPVPRAVAP